MAVSRLLVALALFAIAYCQQNNDTTTTAQNMTETESTTPVRTESTSSIEAESTTSIATVNPAINQVCPSNVGMNDRIRAKALDMHNYRRSRLAGGLVAKNTGKLYPTASNMLELRYDCELERNATFRVQDCPVNEFNGTQENVYHIHINSASTRVLATQAAIKAWWRVVRTQAGPGVKLVTFRERHVNAPIRTFTRIAWATTAFIGCSAKRCGDLFYVVCRYSPEGNQVESVIYQKGAPCANCPLGYYCRQSLCVKV